MIRRLAISILLFSPISPLLSEANSEPRGPRLVDIFCQEIHRSGSRGPAVLEEEKSWNRLVTLLEQRRPPLQNQSVTLNVGSFRQCVSTLERDFEFGEFVLQGKQFLEGTLREEPKDRPEPPPEQVRGLLEPEVHLPVLGDVRIRPGREFGFDPVHREQLLDRHSRYGELWRRFLDGVRKKAIAYQSTIQIVKNLD